MPRRATVAPHLSVDELHTRYRQTPDPVERTHWQIVWLAASGHHLPEVARLVGYTPNWVRTILRRYNAEGSAGLVDRRHTNPGQPPLLSPALRDELAAALTGPAPDGGLWTCRKVADWMAARLGRPVGEPRGWEALRSLGFTPQRPRPRATTADPAAQAAFKKGGSPPHSPPARPPTPPRP
jgi:transposase